MRKDPKEKAVPTEQEIKAVMPNQHSGPSHMPMQGSRRLSMARAMNGSGREVNNLMNPLARKSRYGG